MNFRDYNDFEIIKLIKEGDDEAFQLMVYKYKFFIAKKIKQFNLVYDFDDCYQEALILLHKSVIKFDENYNKTFTRFFELNLINYYISYKKKKNNYFQLVQETLPAKTLSVFEDPKVFNYLDDEIHRAINELSDFEKQVYQIKVIGLKTVRETAQELKTNEKRIYNALDRIKKKIKIHLIR